MSRAVSSATRVRAAHAGFTLLELITAMLASTVLVASLAATVVMTFEAAGREVFNESITIDIPAVTNRPTYGGTTYYGGSDYYGVPFAGRLTRQQFAPPGRMDAFQVRLRVESSQTFEIQEVGIRFQAAS